MVKIQVVVQAEVQVQAETQVQAQEQMQEPGSSTPPLLGELERRTEEAKRLEEVGRLPKSSPTQQLVQMAVEVGSSVPAREELMRKKMQSIVGGKVPPKEFLCKCLIKRPQKY